MIRVQVDDTEVRAMLLKLQRRMGNLRPVMRQIGHRLRNDAIANFKGQHGPDGRPWPRLSPVTLMARARRVTGKGLYTKDRKRTRSAAYRVMTTGKALLDTGVLRNSVQVLDVTHDSVTVGSRLPYAAIQQFGGQAGRGRRVTIPPRPFIGLSAAANRQIFDLVNRYFGTVQR